MEIRMEFMQGTYNFSVLVLVLLIATRFVYAILTLSHIQHISLQQSSPDNSVDVKIKINPSIASEDSSD